jgi:hypothetical protein
VIGEEDTVLEAAVVVLALVLAVLAVLTVRLYRQSALMYLLRDSGQDDGHEHLEDPEPRG